MKKRTALLCFTLPGLLATTTVADLVAYWNFNSLSIATASVVSSGGVPTSITTNQGAGTLSLTGFTGLVDDFGGSTINAVSPDAAGASLSLVAGGTAAPFPGNGGLVELSLNLADFADPIVTFATRGTSTGFNTGTWSYSTDGVNFTTIAGVNTASVSTTFALATVDLSAFNVLDGASNVKLRYTVSGATSNTGNNRIDNLQVNATRTADTVAPLASSFAPLDDATGVPITVTPTATFNEAVKKGTGNVLIKRSADNSIFETIPISSSQVVVSGSAVTLTPTSSLLNSTSYYIEIPAGAIEDIVGNDYAGISGANAWNFTTIAASALPMVAETFTTQTRVTPTGSSTTTDYYGEGNGMGTFAVYGFGTFNFSKLDFGLSGGSTITGVNSAVFTLTHNDRTFTAGTELEFFLTTDASTGKTFNPAFVNGVDNTQYTFAPISLGKFPYTPGPGGSTDSFTLDLSAVAPALVSRLNTGEDFSIILAATTPAAAITYSGKGNTFDPGDPSLKLTVTETTGVDTTPPVLAFLNPADGSNGVPISSIIRIAFNELVQKGTGDITIRRTSDNSIFESIPVTGSNVTISSATVTIDPAAAFETGASYYVQIAPTAIEDIAGNDFAGINDATTWNFSTAQPPISNIGPFAISENAPAGTIVGDLGPAVNGKEGIQYAILGGNGGSTAIKGVPGTGYLVNPIFTIGDTFENATGALNSSSAGNYSPVGILDGIGAYTLNSNTVRVLVNHEIALPNTGNNGYPYTLSNGTVIAKGAARVSYFDIDKTSRRVTDAGLAISRIYDRGGNVVTNANQLDLGGLDRLCSSSLFEPNIFGAGRGLVDRIYFTGEETATSFGHPHGGTLWALDPSNGDLWALPDFGRGSWENAALVDTGSTTHVAFLLGDDTPATPLYLYVGEKSTAPGANFIQRNGLSGGQLYVWKTSNGDLTPQQFNGTGASRSGSWVSIQARNAAAAGTAGHDAAGYKNDVTLENEADTLGAFSFSRPEDVSTSPNDGTVVAFTSTGRGSIYPADNWGDTYIVDLDFTTLTAPTATVRILYDGDDRGGNQFPTSEAGLRSPDNLDWADDGFIYVQEDQANQTGSFGAAGFEASIWKLNAANGQATRIAEVDRSTVLPLGSTDGDVTDVGNWESSGILDVSNLFGEQPGSLMLFDVQAHSITNGLIASKTLFQGGQLCFLEKGIETGAFKLNPNTGTITLANPDALNLQEQPVQYLRVQAFDGTNSTLREVMIQVTNAPVARSNNFKASTYNGSLNRAASGALITDLATVNNSQAADIARIIQRNNPDVLLLNEFDYDVKGVALRRFKENYLEVAQPGESAVYYPYQYVVDSNTGVASGFDLDNNGTAVTTPGAPGYGEDALGFGVFPGQFAFVILSKFPIDQPNVRTFQKFLWKDMPGAQLPDDPDLAGTGDWYSSAELNVFRLSSKSHVDLPVLVNGTPVHILASHPTPPVFDSPGAGLPWKAGVDHNGRRNSDEIRFWADYINPANSNYIYDDTETFATRSGGLPANTRFIICGDQNADNNEGDSTDPAIKALIGGGTFPTNPLVNSSFTPAGGAGPNPDDTAPFSGGVRVDYVLPSSFGLTHSTSGVFWPASGSGDPIAAILDATDHRLVFVNLTLSDVLSPPNANLAAYYLPAQGTSGNALQNALHNIIDDHTMIEYSNADDIMQVIDAADLNNVRLIYSNANLPKTAFVGSGVPTATSWNREHVWPRSDGVGNEGADYSDLHHLFPCQVNVNSLRSNFPFDEGSNAGTSDPFAPESTLDGNSWEPLDRDKGVAARAQLYMMVRYDGNDSLTTDLLLADNPNPVGTQGVLSTLLAWHRAFPPTDYERLRNNAIYSGVEVGSITYAQGNRNPFIDIPQFADAIFLDSQTNSFSKWQTERFSISQILDANISSRNADPDGDGRSNYQEFLMNGNPNSGADTPLALQHNGNQITLTFFRPKGLSVEMPNIQTTTTLDSSSWSIVPLTGATITNLGSYERVEQSISITPEAESRRFWRLIYQ